MSQIQNIDSIIVRDMCFTSDPFRDFYSFQTWILRPQDLESSGASFSLGVVFFLAVGRLDIM